MSTMFDALTMDNDSRLKTLDQLFGCLNDRFKCHLPRLENVKTWPALRILLNMELVDPLPDDTPLPPLIPLRGEWVAAADLVLCKLCVHVCPVDSAGMRSVTHNHAAGQISGEESRKLWWLLGARLSALSRSRMGCQLWNSINAGINHRRNTSQQEV